MSIRRTLPLLAPLVVCGHVLGQEEAERVAPRPALALLTADQRIARSFATLFGPDATLRELQPREHHEVVVSTDGKVTIDARPGDGGWLRLTIHPRAVMELFRKQIDKSWDKIRGVAILGLSQLGIEARQSAVIMEAIRDFPDQLQRIDVAISQDVRSQPKGAHLRIAVHPATGSWLSSTVERLRPHDQGAPVIEAQDPLVTMAVAVRPDDFSAAVEPFLDTLSHIGTKNRKERSRARDIYAKLLTCQDGTFYSAGDPFGGTYRAASGLRDAKALGTLIQNGDYATMIKATAGFSPLLDVEFESNAFVHRGVDVMKISIQSDIDTPTMPTGEQITYSALAGTYLLTSTAEKPETTKSLIDAALDQKIRRRPLPDGALMLAEFKLMDLLDKVLPNRNPFAGMETPPKSLRLTSDNKGGSLNFDVQLR